MITALHLGNFKAFGEIQRLPIKPLTLVFGPNSSGKSSLIHGLLFARHAFETGDLDVNRTTVGGDSVDLGGFGQYVHRRNLENRVRLRLDFGAPRPVALLQELGNQAPKVSVEIAIGCEVSDRGELLRHGAPRIITVSVSIDDSELMTLSNRMPATPSQAILESLLQFEKPKDLGLRGGFRLDRIRLDHPVAKSLLRNFIEGNTTIQRASPEDIALAEASVDSTIAEFSLQASRLLPRKHSTTIDGPLTPDLVAVRGDRQRETLEKAFRLYLPRVIGDFLGQIEDGLNELLGALTYLGPLRSYPPRHLIGLGNDDRNWIAGGAYAWEVVRRNETVRNAVNEWLSSKDRLKTPYSLRIQRYIAPDHAEEVIADSLRTEEPIESVDPEELSLGVVNALKSNPSLERWDELLLRDLRTNTIVSHRDVGIGVSQVLPVLVHAYADRQRIVAIEQPEIHLHPALQADLGDLFIESALGPNKNTFVLETHSEHLILRILRRVRETTEGNLPDGHCAIRPEDIAVLYTQPSQRGVEVIELPVTPDGDFGRPWPGGFFAERFEDLP